MTDDTREPAELSPEDDAAVRDLLAALPDPEVPADVEARVNAALAAEAARTDAPAAASNVSVLIARDPDDRSRSGARSHGSRSTRNLQVAAGVAVLAVAAGIAVSVASNHSSSNSGGGATSAAGPAAVPVTVPVTVSRTAYDAKNLDRGIQALVANTPAEAAAAAGTPATTASVSKPVAGALPTVAASVSLAAVTSLVRDQSRRAACVAALAGTTDVTPVAIDVGTYDKHPAIVVVLPDPDDPAVLDGWVVGPSCSDANTIPYTYHHVPRP